VHWLFLILALGALVVAFITPQMWLLLLALLVALVLLLAWLRGVHLRRIGDLQRDATLAIDPTELRRLHALAEARRAGLPDPTI
jgi:hypothetical protein